MKNAWIDGRRANARERGVFAPEESGENVGDSGAADLQTRFSLEVVNKEFYREISESFIKLVGGTVGSGKNQKTYKPILKLPSVAENSQISL